jgi:hypothetical protein
MNLIILFFLFVQNYFDGSDLFPLVCVVLILYVMMIIIKNWPPWPPRKWSS